MIRTRSPFLTFRVRWPPTAFPFWTEIRKDWTAGLALAVGVVAVDVVAVACWAPGWVAVVCVVVPEEESEEAPSSFAPRAMRNPPTTSTTHAASTTARRMRPTLVGMGPRGRLAFLVALGAGLLGVIAVLA